MVKKQFSRKIRNLIAEFRGLPPEQSRSFLKRAKSVGETVSVLMKRINGSNRRPEAVIQNNWQAIVGVNLAKYCEPVKILPNDVFLVRCPNAVARSELQMIKGRILDNLHKFHHCEKISDIRFVANG